MEVLIQGTISAIGYWDADEGVYYQEPDCYETLRDVVRFLRNDSNLLARRACGERNIIENDLIPIIKSPDLTENMFDITLRLLANLVQPSMVSLAGQAPEDKEQWQTYWTLENNLKRSKLAFADVAFFNVLRRRMEKYFLNTNYDDRTEDERLVMERIVILLRYIFSMSSTVGDSKRTNMDANSHDRVIVAFIESGIENVLVHIASQSHERDFHLSVLEIIALIIKEHRPADLVSAVHGRSDEEKKREEAELQKAVEMEMMRGAALRRKVLSNRHSRFAGSYVVKGLHAVNKENDFVVNKVVKDVNKLSFLEERKRKRVIARNRRPFEASEKTHLSSLELRVKLKEFVENILSKAFNRLMKNTRELAFNGRRSLSQKNADLHFLLVQRFFLEFTRLAKLSTDVVKNCIGTEAFHKTQIQMEEYMQNATTLRREAKHYGIRAQYALSTYKELVLIHMHMLEKGTQEEKDAAEHTCEHILHVEEYRELGYSLISRFQPAAFSKTFLRELVLTNHHYLRLLEKSVKSGRLTTVTKRAKRRKQRAAKKAEHSETDSTRPGPVRSVVDSLNTDELDQRWAGLSSDLSDVIIGHEPAAPDQIPINGLLEADDEEQQRFAMLYVQRALREQRIPEAVGLYRAARDVWLTEGVFGSIDISDEEEFIELREVYFADLTEVSDALLKSEKATDVRLHGQELAADWMEGGADDYDEMDEEADDRAKYDTKEVPFEFTEYVSKYAKNAVLRWYVFLLIDFEKNSVELNSALVKLLHRIAFDLKMPCRLYQLTLFRVFYRLNDKMSVLSKEEKKKSPLYELYTFGFHLLKKFFVHLAEVGDLLAPETLFWKGAKECYEIENGYGTYEKQKAEVNCEASTWPEALEDEVRSLWEEYRNMDERPEGLDILDFIEHNLTRQRTRKQLYRKMRMMGLDTYGAKGSKDKFETNFPLIELRKIVEQYDQLDNTDKKVDLVNFVRQILQDIGRGEFSRQRIIKQLQYIGVTYEGKTTSKKTVGWPEELMNELTVLVQQYQDMDSSDHELVSLPDYVMRLLSVKKPKRQIEDKLESLGAKFERQPKKIKSTGENKSSKKKKTAEEVELDNFVASDEEEEVLEPMDMNEDDSDDASVSVNDVPSSNRKRRMVMDSDDEESGSEDRTEVSVEKDDTIVGPVSSKKRRIIDSDDDDENVPSRLDEGSNFAKKRKLVDDDEESEERYEPAQLVTAADDFRQGRDASNSPVKVSAKKKKLIIESDDEE